MLTPVLLLHRLTQRMAFCCSVGRMNMAVETSPHWLSYMGSSTLGGCMLIQISQSRTDWLTHLTSICVCRFNCGTGTAQIVSGSRVALDQWHSVVVGREGVIGWLRLDNDTPVTGHSQVRTIHSVYRTYITKEHTLLQLVNTHYTMS